MTKEQISKKKTYDMSFEEAQEYIIKCGFAIPWNDGDVFVDEREITRTVGNVLKWRIESIWHKPDEQPKRNRVYLAQMGEEAFDTFYDSNNWESFSKGLNITRWAYIKDLLPEDNK